MNRLMRPLRLIAVEQGQLYSGKASGFQKHPRSATFHDVPDQGPGRARR